MHFVSHKSERSIDFMQDLPRTMKAKYKFGSFKRFPRHRNNHAIFNATLKKLSKKKNAEKVVS